MRSLRSTKATPSLAVLVAPLALVSAQCVDVTVPNPVAGPTTHLAPGSPWPKFRGNLAQTGRSSVLPSKTGGTYWDFKTGKGVFSSPIVGADGTVYVGSADRSFYAIGANGKLRWKVDTGEIIDSAGLLDDEGRVYFGSGDGILRACDAATGAVEWQFQADAPSVNAAYLNWFEGNVAMGVDGTLYAPNDDYFVFAIDRKTGAATWKFKMPDQTWSSPAVDAASGTLFIGNNELVQALGKNVYSLGNDGSNEWNDSIPGTVAASPVLLSNGNVVVGGFDGYVHALSGADGTELWKTPTRDHIYASPALLSDGTIIQPSADGTIYALDPTTGKVRWTFDTPEPIRSSPAIDGADDIYVGGGDGTLYVVNPNGTLRWSMRLIDDVRQNLNASPALGAQAVYAGGESGEVFSVPYDDCLRSDAASNAACSTKPPSLGPSEGAGFVFTKAFGGLAAEPPAEIDANQTLAFTLLVRKMNVTQLDILDSSSVEVVTSPPTPVSVDVSGDGKFLEVTPATPFTPDSNGNVTVTIAAKYLTDLTRSGLALSGGTPGGSVSQSFTFALRPPDGYPLPFPVPSAPGDPSGELELSRISLPYPTILPSYNQIGFDSLHYLIGFVEGNENHAIAWMAGAKLVEGQAAAVIDPATGTLLPLVVDYRSGLVTLANTSGLTVNVQNVDIPLSTFRVTAHLDASGTATDGAHLTGSTVCGKIPTYGTFLEQLGFCNPQTDTLTVLGGANLAPFGSGFATMPSVGTVSFSATADAITATLTGANIASEDHVSSILLVDPASDLPITLSYGLVTKRSPATGTLTSVTVPLAGAPMPLPPLLRAYLMIDTYPAARATIVVP